MNVRPDERLIQVVAYSGYQAEQEPRALVVDGRRLDVTQIEDRWYDPAGSWFRVRTEDGRGWLLRYDLETLEWSQVGKESCTSQPSATSSPPSPTEPGR